MNKLELLLRIGGALHFTVLIASAMVPRVLDWKSNLARLHPFLRQLFWVYGAFIVLVIAGFGTLTLCLARTMAGGGPLGRSVCAFIAIFWMARLLVQWFVFDCRAFLTNWVLVAGYHGLNALFSSLVIIYGWAALFAIKQ